ncbi:MULTISPECIES: flagellar motor switch protein FliG [unclassified Beijerinckia]|uniref:flagellar motor switch protein FliG n=1 Tax=unclassified Beijerinckia TaxID=2638183 RepID=UPI00089C6524|nr:MULTISPECIES: flagellar motor switch protein FliG [unclassified Beijerinckia]MDH7798682.1 flagellar motor switch protein FliG [Beijerinckia sp. GAS462]SED29262.1 flagellar motor switch protein FliG [Beijerinckia sp. 28-YEA-48]
MGTPVSWLRGVDKVAALLLTMNKSDAGRLLKHFNPQELKDITRSIATLREIQPDVVQRLVDEFAADFSSGTSLVGSTDDAEKLLAEALPADQVSALMSDVLGSSSQGLWDQISRAPEGDLANYLAGEHSQTSALVLSKISPVAAAAVLRLLPDGQRNDVSFRMLELQPVSEAALRLIGLGLQQELLSGNAGKSAGKSHTQFADIMNRLERDQMEGILQNIAESRPEAAEAVRSQLFTFEDVVKLSTKARLILFEKVPVETVILALNGTEASFKDLVLSSLSSRAKRMVEQELASSQGVSKKDVGQARRKVADTVLAMAERNELEIHDE